LPFPDDSFDSVILSEILEHVDDDVRGLAEVRRVLKPGGVVAITVPNANYPFLWDPINKTLETLFGIHIQRGPLAGIWANHVRLYERDQLRHVVEQAGLIVEQERAFTFQLHRSSTIWCMGWASRLLEMRGAARFAGHCGLTGRSSTRTAAACSIRSTWGWPCSMRRPPEPANEPEGVSTVNLCVRGASRPRDETLGRGGRPTYERITARRSGSRAYRGSAARPAPADADVEAALPAPPAGRRIRREPASPPWSI
jgi:hypothetical protein